MKYAFIASIIFLLAGCAEMTAPSQSYRPANYAGAPWNISGDINRFSYAVVIKINNQVVINDKLALWTHDGEFSGNYEGKAVTASCMNNMNRTINCFVFVNGEKATTLTFLI